MNQNVPMTPFAMAVVEFGLTLEQQDKARKRATLFKVAMDDPDIYRICQQVALEGDLDRGISKIEDLTSKLSAEIEERTDTLVSSVSTEIGNAIREKIDNLPGAINDKVDAHIEKRVEAIAQKVAIATNNDRDRLEFRSERRKDRREYGMILIGVLALSIGLVAVTRSVTWDQAMAVAGRGDQLEKRPDYPTWLNLIRYTDGNKAMAQFCGPSQQIVIDGRRHCQFTLPIEPGLQSKTGLDGLVAIWREVQVQLGTWGLIGLGVIGTLLTTWTRRRLKTT